MNEPQLNPYAAPQTTELGLVNFDSPDEKERRYYLKHETSIRSFSLIYFVGGAILLILVFVIVISTWNGPGFGPSELAILAIQTVIGVAQLIIAVAIRKLTKFGRLGGTVLAVLGLVAIPVGTLLSAYFLYLLWSEKAVSFLLRDTNRSSNGRHTSNTKRRSSSGSPFSFWQP